VTRPFLVEVLYREPGYETRHGARAEPYRFRYRIHAGNEASARWLALDEFRRISELSSVGWVRDVVSVAVVPVTGPDVS
jgi:hypothetical protein